MTIISLSFHAKAVSVSVFSLVLVTIFYCYSTILHLRIFFLEIIQVSENNTLGNDASAEGKLSLVFL